jgi:nucleoside-diphosphate-sugar epimerase
MEDANAVPTAASTTVPSKKRVLITGAEGAIGTALRKHLTNRYDLRCLTRTPQDFPSFVANVADFEAILPAFEGIDAVVHLAASAGIDTPWEPVLRNNIVGTYNVYEAARRAGVGAVVFASSNHVIGMYEVDGAPEIFEPGDPRMVDHTAEIRPDSLYGVSKAYGEALARFYLERHGIRGFCLRIGAVRAGDDPTDPAVLERSPAHLDLRTPEVLQKRMNAVWFSQRDCAELVASCLDADHVRWAVVYGVSDNPGRFWDVAHAKELLGWEPRDRAPE